MLQTYVSFLINAILRAVNFIKQQKLFARGSPSRQGAGAPVPTSGTSTTFFRVLTNIFHRCFHLYALMGSNIIVCIYGVAYTFIQLFKAVIFAVKQPPILNRVIHPFSQGIMSRISTLRHTNIDMMFLEHIHIQV